jgi:opacity protein-like surface antigen
MGDAQAGVGGQGRARARGLIAAVAAVVVLAAACTASADHPTAFLAPLPPDPHTPSALLKIAATFNRDYDTGAYAAVYARWDPRSQAIITRAS